MRKILTKIKCKLFGHKWLAWCGVVDQPDFRELRLGGEIKIDIISTCSRCDIVKKN